MSSPSSLEKAIDLLFHLHGLRESRGVTALAAALGLPKSSVHRTLATLAKRGLLERDARGRYRPGVALIALGLGVLDRDPVAVAARPVLEAEAEAIGETVFLAAARAGALVVLDKAEGSGFLRAAPRVGSAVPVHATAVGKLYLAFAPDQVTLGQGALERFTPRTPSTREELAREVERARQRGFAENRGEWIQGLWGVAAPVFAGGRMVAGLALAAPEPRMEARVASAVTLRTLEAARRVGARLAPDAGARRTKR